MTSDSQADTAGGQVLSVRVPEGRLYLDPNEVEVEISASPESRTSAQPVLVADLRDSDPGWRLVAWITSIGDGPAKPSVEVGATIEPIVGAACGVATSPPQVVQPGQHVVVADGAPVTGWGSYWVSISVRRSSSGSAAEQTASVRVHYELISR